MKKNTVHFICVCAMVAMLSSQTGLLGMMVESGEFETEHVQPTVQNNARPASPSHAILSEMVQNKLTNSGQQETQLSPLTTANLAQHNESQTPINYQNTSRARSLQSSSSNSLGIEMPTIANHDQLDLSHNFDTNSTSSQTDSLGIEIRPAMHSNQLDYNNASRSTSPTSSQRSRSNSSASDDSLQINSHASILTPQKSSFPTGLEFALNASDAANRAGQALYKAAGSASSAASRFTSAMYDAAGHVVQAVRTIPGEIYKAPGNVAKNVFGHPDGNILTGNTYSVASAGRTAYNSLPNIKTWFNPDLKISNTNKNMIPLKNSTQIKTHVTPDPTTNNPTDVTNPDNLGSGSDSNLDANISNADYNKANKSIITLNNSTQITTPDAHQTNPEDTFAIDYEAGQSSFGL